MINVVANSDELETLVAGLSTLSQGFDLTPLAQIIADMMWQDRVDAQLRGEDGYGEPLESLSASTLKKRKGSGFPLSPFDGSSQVVTNYGVTIVEVDSEHFLLRGEWDGIPWLIHHLEGRERGSRPDMPNWSLPQRDIAHIRPETWEQIGEAIQSYCLMKIDEILGSGGMV